MIKMLQQQQQKMFTLKYVKNIMYINTEKSISFSCCSLKDLMYSSVTFADLAILTELCFDNTRKNKRAGKTKE